MGGTSPKMNGFRSFDPFNILILDMTRGVAYAADLLIIDSANEKKSE